MVVCAKIHLLAARQAILKRHEWAVNRAVIFGQLDNSATYASATVLEAKTKNLTVNEQNSVSAKQGRRW